jgi:cell division protein FtsW (lipid II flippase)
MFLMLTIIVTMGMFMAYSEKTSPGDNLTSDTYGHAYQQQANQTAQFGAALAPAMIRVDWYSSYVVLVFIIIAAIMGAVIVVSSNSVRVNRR